MSSKGKVRITECPRDAMQGLSKQIPTSDKILYLNTLLKVGYDILDFGSFVSPKAIPQLSDTVEVMKSLNLENSNTKLLAIVGNMRGAMDASKHDVISYLGFPFSISDTFLRMNINSNIDKAFGLCHDMLELCDNTGKELMVYLSMAFGNRYNDPWSPNLVAEWVYQLQKNGAHEINLSDTIGISTIESVHDVFSLLIDEFPRVNFGFHLHSKSNDWYDKIDIAYKSGCRSFDGILSGAGGCPMTGSEMVGNLRMSNLISYFDKNNIEINLNRDELAKASEVAASIFI